MHSSSSAVAIRTGTALTIVAVAALAAALSHLAIDALGDIVLAHDTYDDVAHDSRTVVAAFTVAALLAAAVRSIYGALRSALGRPASRRVLRIASPLRFVGGVLALVVPFVLAMEATDAFVAGRAVTDLDDLFGGSILLGLGTTLTTAIAVALAALAGMRFFCASQTLLVRVVIGLFIPREGHRGNAFTGIGGGRLLLVLAPALARHAAKRGPPLLTSFAPR